MDKQAKIYVAGGNTLIGAALVRQLQLQGYVHVLNQSESEPVLTDAHAVDAFFARVQPEYVFLAAGKSGGILANQKYPATLMLDNLLIESHVIHSAHQHGVKKLLYLASSCSYPKHCAQPMLVESLMTGPLEPTNEAYAVAKIAGIKLCQAYRQEHGSNFIVGIPANSFGPDDDFSLAESHVIPALIRKMHEAKQANAPTVEIWGTGTPRREFVFADDLADACIFVMHHYDQSTPLNIGGGLDVSIRELAEFVQSAVGYRGDLAFNANYPDGMPLKALDATELVNMGWQPKTSFEDALARTYAWFLQHEGTDALDHSLSKPNQIAHV